MDPWRQLEIATGHMRRGWTSSTCLIQRGEFEYREFVECKNKDLNEANLDSTKDNDPQLLCIALWRTEVINDVTKNNSDKKFISVVNFSISAVTPVKGDFFW
jgi:hypothetical protein